MYENAIVITTIVILPSGMHDKTVGRFECIPREGTSVPPLTCL